MSSGFSSIFKIDGVPILPPLMTAEVRAEAARYRQMAMEIERKLHKTKIESVCQLEQQQEQERVQTPDLEAALLTRRESFTLDAPSPGLINLPHSTTPLEEKPADLTKEPTVVTDSEDESPRPRLIRSNSYTLESPSPLLMKHLHNQSLNIKNSMSMGEIESAATKAHVKRLDFGGGDQTPNKKLTAKSGPKAKWVSTKKVSPKPITPVKKHKSPYVSTTVGAKKKVKAATGKQRESSSNNQQQNTPVSECQQRIKDMQTEHERRVKELLKRQEEEQQQLQESFRRQQEELVKMLPVPLLDQIHTSTPLLASPNESTVEEELDPSKPSFRTLNISSKEFVNHNESQSSIGHLSSSQTLFVSSSTSGTSVEFENSDELYRTCENNGLSRQTSSGDANGNFQFHSMRNYLEVIGQSLQDNELKQLTQVETAFENQPSNERDRLRYRAASLINAHVRGYLTRRLFQTDHVQKMVQVIRDTLLFILDLHHEKTLARQQIRSPADVQLKRTLLHQLTSACYQLHDVFFGIGIPQRMEIIRRDREALRRRLENRPRTASSVGSSKSGSRSSATTNTRKQLSLRKLQMCSLYSVNIEGEPVADDPNANATESPMINADYISKPKHPAANAASAPPSRSSLRSTSSHTSSPSLSATVVSRLVHQVKKAVVVSPNQLHCQKQQTKVFDLRPKTSDAALAGGSPYRRTSWEQRYL